jgi:hypothetical protein
MAKIVNDKYLDPSKPKKPKPGNNISLPMVIDPTTGKQWQPGGVMGSDEKGNPIRLPKPPSKPQPKPPTKPTAKPSLTIKPPTKPTAKPSPALKPKRPVGGTIVPGPKPTGLDAFKIVSTPKPRSNGGITGPGGKQVNPVYNTY